MPHAAAAPGRFAIKDCALLAIATGRRIYTLSELRDAIGQISTDSLYYHFWGGLMQPRFEEREFNNDFAAWVRHGLHDTRLAERIAMVDPREYQQLDDLRLDLMDLIDERLDEDAYLHWIRATQSFEFIRSQIVVFATDHEVASPEQLTEVIPALSTGSVFYHLIDARRRVPEAGDDFRAWLAGFGDQTVALREAIGRIDPYFAPLTEVRKQLVCACREGLAG